MVSDTATLHKDAKLLRDQGLETLRSIIPGIPGDADYQMRDGGFGDELLEMGLVSVWGQLWSREGLARRDRSLVTIALLIAQHATTELQSHVRMALTNGVTRQEIEEVIYHASGYVGFPACVSARTAARAALDSPAPSRD